MTELLRICEAGRKLASSDGRLLAADDERALWLATVVRVVGSGYRRPGARLLFTRDRPVAGSVSGGCLEKDLIRTGPWLAARGPVVKTYDAREEDSAPVARTGCGGSVDILIESLDPRLLESLGRALLEEARVLSITVHASRHRALRVGERMLFREHEAEPVFETVHEPWFRREFARVSKEALRSGSGTCTWVSDSFDALVEVVEPPPHLFVFGLGEDVRSVVELARTLGWNVSVAGPHVSVSARERFFGKAQLLEGPPSAVVQRLERCARPLALLMSHDYERDKDALGALIGSRARYIGVLGPMRRTERLLTELEQSGRGVSPEMRSRVHGPAGLHLGGDTAPEVALSIVAEAQAALWAASGVPLSLRDAAIHEPTPVVLTQAFEALGA
ncbi:MAG TPA: XdhC family protein [Polyangiaceae bacterium]|nr:XdhC family protein [Polyangiaceae bacterium]